MSTEDLKQAGYRDGRATDAGSDRCTRLLLEAARHIESLERGLMGLARLPVQAHAARLGLLHELLSCCGQGITGELKVAAALRTAVAGVDEGGAATPWGLSD